jgi:hypothetical protein
MSKENTILIIGLHCVSIRTAVRKHVINECMLNGHAGSENETVFILHTYVPETFGSWRSHH